MLFSSITAADIPADSQVRGTRMLRALLHFAESGKLSAGAPNGDFDSPFEDAVARVIRQAGYDVHPQVGVSSFRIDLGVLISSKPGEYLLGVECDGATYHRARSARDRDRLRQEVLEGLGWRLHRIWSTDWFRHQERETQRLLSAIRDADSRARILLLRTRKKTNRPVVVPQRRSPRKQPLPPRSYPSRAPPMNTASVRSQFHTGGTFSISAWVKLVVSL